MPYIAQRWLGGTLTNFRTIRQRIDYMMALERRLERGELERLPKKEALGLKKDLTRLNERLGGLRNVGHVPDLLFIVDVQREELAVTEANKLHIPIVAMVDTNCNPDPIDYPIPSNDDAIRAIKLMTGKIADAVIEGLQMRAVDEAEQAAAEPEIPAAEPMIERVTEEPGRADEYLGPSILAKLAQGDFGEDEEN
jgi:small subunit ribosomal protein S2